MISNSIFVLWMAPPGRNSAGGLGGKLARGHQAGATPEHGGGRFALPVLLSLVFLSIIGYGIVVPLLPFYGELFGAPPWPR